MTKHLFIALAAMALAGPAFAEESAPAAVEVAAVAAAPAAVPAVVAERREMILSASGARVGNVLSLNEDGSPRVIFEQHVVSIPTATLSRDGEGRLTTSLTHRELRQLY